MIVDHKKLLSSAFLKGQQSEKIIILILGSHLFQ